MTKQKTEENRLPFLFWTGTFTLALVIFLFFALVKNFIEHHSNISKCCLMLVAEIVLLLFGIYCLKKGKGNTYSLKADLLPVLIPVLIISLFLGLGKSSPVGSIGYFLGWNIGLLLLFLFPLIYFFYFFHRRELRKKGIGSTPMSERNKKIVELDCSYNKAFKLCIEALRSVKKELNILDLDVDKSSGTIIAKTGPTYRLTCLSCGETITFNIRKVNDKVRIEVISRSTRPLVLFDYGKNYENVKKIVSFFKNKLAKKSV